MGWHLKRSQYFENYIDNFLPLHERFNPTDGAMYFIIIISNIKHIWKKNICIAVDITVNIVSVRPMKKNG